MGNSKPLQLADRPVDERFYCEGRLARNAIISVWAIVIMFSFWPLLILLAADRVTGYANVTLVVASMIAGFLLIASPLHLYICRHTWYIDADATGLLLYRLFGKKRIGWNQIEHINYSGQRHTVQNVVVDGAQIPIPNCINSKVLSRIIEANAAAKKKQCHHDYLANNLKVIRANSPALIWGLRLMGFFLTSMVIAAGFGMRMDTGFAVVLMTVLLPGTIMLHAITNLRRATAVRVTERGLGIKTFAAHYEIAWNDFNKIEVDEADKIIRVSAKAGPLTLGPELTNYDELARQLNAKVRELAKARIRQQDEQRETQEQRD